MTVWEVLGIDSTEDTSVIKKAYAKKLRQHHPEDDPEGYQRLREAYDKALKQAKYMAERRSWEYEEDDDNDGEEWIDGSDSDFYSKPEPASPVTWQEPEEHEEDLQSASKCNEIALSEQRDSAHTISGFMSRLDDLYNDFYARIDPAAWETLLNSDIVWNVEQSEQLQDAILYYLEDHPNLPRAVWERLDTVFHWSEEREDLPDRYDNDYLGFVRQEIIGSLEMGYDFFTNSGLPGDFDFDGYLELREDVRSLMMKGDMETAGRYLEQIRKMYTGDPDVELLRGKWFMEAGDPEMSLACYESVISLRPDDLDARWLRSELLFERGSYTEALQDCEFILGKQPDNTDAHCMAGRCHLELGDHDTMLSYMKKAHELDSKHMPTLIYWSESTSRTTADLPKPTSEQKRKSALVNLYFHFLLVVRLSWLFIFVYLCMQLFFDVHPLYTGLLGALLLWHLWKSFRVNRVLKKT